MYLFRLIIWIRLMYCNYLNVLTNQFITTAAYLPRTSNNFLQ